MAFDSPTSDQDVQRAEAAKRLKSAERSMIVSAVITVLLLAVTVAAFLSGRYSASDSHGQTTLFGTLGAIILLRFAYRGWRLYTTWKNLKDAQEAHRSFQ